eukprot:10312999-Ditylum_brightwellii.AAC.2
MGAKIAIEFIAGGGSQHLNKFLWGLVVLATSRLNGPYAVGDIVAEGQNVVLKALEFCGKTSELLQLILNDRFSTARELPECVVEEGNAISQMLFCLALHQGLDLLLKIDQRATYMFTMVVVSWVKCNAFAR